MTGLVRKIREKVRATYQAALKYRCLNMVKVEKVNRFRLRFNKLRFCATGSHLKIARARLVVHQVSPPDNYAARALQKASTYPASQQKERIASILRHYRDTVPVYSCAQRYGFKTGEVPELDEAPPWLIIYPWSNYDISTGIALKNNGILLENKRDGLYLDARQGGASFPLQDDRKIDFEARKLLSLYQSITDRGYQPDQNAHSQIGAVLLIDENGDWVWHVSGGFHRVTVLQVCGYTEIPVTVHGIIYRSEVKSWPNVTSGLFTADTALTYFDNIFHGRGFKEHNAWTQQKLPD